MPEKTRCWSNEDQVLETQFGHSVNPFEAAPGVTQRPGSYGRSGQSVEIILVFVFGDLLRCVPFRS